MSTLLHQVLAATLAASSLSEPCVLATAAHGTVRVRGQYQRRELVRDRMDGEVPMLDAETLLTIPEAAAPGAEKGDLVLAGGSLWHVRSALADGAGSVKLQLMVAQAASKGTVAGSAAAFFVVGDVEGEGPLVVLATAGILRAGDEVRVRAQAYVAGAPVAWEPGYAATVLTPV